MWCYVIALIVVIAGILYVYRRRKHLKFTQGQPAEMYERIIHAIPDMIFVFDENCRIIKHYNLRLKALLVPPDKLAGTDMRQLLDPALAGIIETGIEEVKKSDDIFESEYQVEIDHEIKYFEARFLQIDENQTACLVRDISDRKKSDLILKHNQELLNSVLDNIPFPIMLKDVDDDFRYIYWNRECDAQAGFKRNEILGKTDFDIYGEERGKLHRKTDCQVVERGVAYRNQETFMTPDRAIHDTIVIKNLINNDFHHWLLITRWDISDLVSAQRKLREMNQLNQLILNNTNVGFIFLNPDYMIQWENVSTTIASPLAAAYKTGTVCYRNVKGLDEPCEKCYIKRAMDSREKEQLEIKFSENLLVDIVATPVWDEEHVFQGIVMKVEDITAKKRAEEELKRAKEDAEKSDRLKSAFLANMSHEIRTPLNAIVGFSELLYNTEDESEKQNYIQIIRNNNEVLLGLINDILDLSKIEANTLEFIYSDVDINMMLQDFCQTMRYKSKNNALEICFDRNLPHCVIYTEKNRLLQVISNLVTNALKFTEKGKVSFGYERRDRELYFYVKDTGIGIPADKQEAIFGRFVKLNNFKTGTGLGLAICQTIVCKLGGQIGVESEPGSGSVFWFTVPCALVNENHTEDHASGENDLPSESIRHEPSAEPGRKLTLLIAEDVVDNYKLYTAFLKNKYNLIHAWNGKEAVELFKTVSPDVILMDIKMPEMDGFEATAAIRNTGSRIPIIAVTAFAFPEDKKKIMNSGFTDYLTKPFSLQSITAVLEKIRY